MFEGGGGGGMAECGGGGGVLGGGDEKLFVKFWESFLLNEWDERWDSGGLLVVGSMSYSLVDVFERSFSPPGGPGTGFLPSLMAFLISAAFHIAYFCFCSRSG